MNFQENGDCFVDPLVDETQHNMSESQFEATNEEDYQHEVNNNKKRGENFTHEEDEILVRSWLNTSMDAIASNDQKLMTFWNRVSHLYVKNTKSEFPQRSVTSLNSRWQFIQKSVNKFQGFLTQIERRNQSGIGDAEKFDEAMAMYRNFQKRGFQFKNCWNILRKHPKWINHGKSNSSKRKLSGPSPTIPNAVNIDGGTTTADVYENLERPIGKKAAKEKLKREKNKGTDGGSADVAILTEWKEEKKKMHEEKMSMQERRMKMEEEKLKLMSVDLENSNRIKEKRLEIEQKKIENQEAQEDRKLMFMDTSDMDDVQRLYIQSLRNELLSKKM